LPLKSCAAALLEQIRIRLQAINKRISFMTPLQP
jgi:hypothetical protein